MRSSVVSLVALVSALTLAQVACGGGEEAPAPLVSAEGGASPVPSASASSSNAVDGGAAPLPGQPARDGGVTPVEPPPPTRPNEITEAFGIFVSTTGQAGAAGTRIAPLASIQAAIELAKSENKKKVFVCAGAYAEALEIADGISLEARIDCADAADWKLDETKHADLEAPTSPALHATNVATATRIDGFHVKSPDATSPSTSSIALLAVDASGLTFANGTLTAGTGMKGDDGTEGESLTAIATETREPSAQMAACFWLGVPCDYRNVWNRPRPKPGAARCTSTVDGRTVSTSRGGEGGQPGTFYRPRFDVPWDQIEAPNAGNAGTGSGADGVSGANGGAGVVSESGFAPGDGTAGTSGQVGIGGRGGNGLVATRAVVQFDYWWGYMGGGGAAGGCEGIAGTAGKGGGASLGVVAIRSAIHLTSAVVTSSAGGAGGSGTLGSDATAGFPSEDNQAVDNAGRPGGRGGFAGLSGGGAGGASIAIAHDSAIVVTSTTTAVGAAGAGAPAKQKVVLGATRALDAAPDGEAVADKTL